MIEKLVIIFALIYAFHGVVDASEIISDDGKVHVVPRGTAVHCIYGWYDGMKKPCAETGKLHKD